MIDEGYTKYACDWQRTAPLSEALVAELNEWRNRLHGAGLVGYYEQQGVGYGVCGAAQPHAVLPAGGGGGHTGQARQDERERARPEGIDQLLRKVGHLAGEVRNALGIGHMHDQRVVAGPPLGGKDLRHGGITAGIGRKAIHRFGG